MNDQNRRIFNNNTDALSIARDIKDILVNQVADPTVAMRQALWRGALATVRYQAWDTKKSSLEFVVANQSGREQDTLEITYERTVLHDGSELESLAAQAGLEARRENLSEQEVFFLGAVRTAMQRAFGIEPPEATPPASQS